MKKDVSRKNYKEGEKMNEGLVTSLNALREMSVSGSSIYHQYIPIIDENTSIATLAEPILSVPAVANEFMSMLVNRIVYTQFETKLYNNPLRVLEGDRIPLGYAGQEIFTNPAKGRKYNVNDFAGLLQKYEADTKIQYLTVNSDLQYPVTVSRHALKKAFTSWADLDRFIDQLSNSLYNGAYIGEFAQTKNLVASAYAYGGVRVQTVSAVADDATAKAFVKKCRNLFLDFQVPSTSFNAWAQVDGSGAPITTWSNPEDIVLILRNSVRTEIDVDVLAAAFNIDKATLMGNILTVDNFDVYDDDGVKRFDGSAIQGIIADKSWFKIKTQDMYLDEFYNPNNRVWTYYLNVTKMYQYSLFANAVVLATSLPTVAITGLSFGTDQVTTAVGTNLDVPVSATPFAGTTAIEFTSSDSDVFTTAAKSGEPRTAVVTPVAAGTAVLTATAGNVTTSVVVKIASA